MPGEWEKHKCTWMAWPTADYGMENWEVAYKAWASVANAIVKYEEVKVICMEEHATCARGYLHADVQIIHGEARL